MCRIPSRLAAEAYWPGWCATARSCTCAAMSLTLASSFLVREVPAELYSVIVHVTELSTASSQCWLSLSGMSVIVFEVTTLLRRVRCRPFVASPMVIASELSSAHVPAGSWGLMIIVIASSMAPEEIWLLPARLWRALSG